MRTWGHSRARGRAVPSGRRAHHVPGRTLLVALVAVSCLGAYSDDLARGNRAWESRGLEDPFPGVDRDSLRDAIDAYERAVDARPERLEARWKLLRALHFRGEFSSEEDAVASFERGRVVSEAGIEALTRRLQLSEPLDELEAHEIRAIVDASAEKRSDVARLYFWAAINWGAASRSMSPVTVVRRGVANRIHRYTRAAIALEPTYDEGGAFRLLGRLHASLPGFPSFRAGWTADRPFPRSSRPTRSPPRIPATAWCWRSRCSSSTRSAASRRSDCSSRSSR